MAGLKEIKRRLKSVKNTKKITYAMKLVSAAKLKKAQDSVTKAREYTNELNSLLARLNEESAGSDTAHPLMQEPNEVKKIKLVVVGGNRGLCGPYNTNVTKEVQKFYEEHGDKEIDALLLGRKPAEYFRRNDLKYSEAHEELSEDANDWPIEEICWDIEQEFLNGSIDEAHFIFTRFKSAITMWVRSEKLLPLSESDAAEEKEASDTGSSSSASGSTLFEPSTEQVFDAIIPRIMRSKLRQACLDAKASEHGSRMTAMDAATTNAGDLIHTLTLQRNRLRQEGITSELLDIIGGAAAVG